MDTRPHRDTRAAFPDAGPGQCRYCGDRCPRNRRSHTDCQESAKAARDHRGAMIERAGGRPDCTYRHTSECAGPIESHHVQELTDNGDKTWTVPACRKHHQERTNEARAARRGRKGAPVSKSKPKAKAAPEGGNPLAVVALAVPVAVIGWALATDSTDRLLYWVRVALDHLPAAAAAAAAAAAVWLLTRLAVRRRAAAITRMGETIARATNTAPDAIRVRCGLSTASGSARYAATFDDRAGTRTRAAVEEAISRKVGHPLTFTWAPHLDTVRWRRRHDDDATEAVPDEERDPEPAQADEVAERVHSALTHQCKGGEVHVRVTDRDRQGPLRMVVTYPDSVRDDTDDTRAAWQDIVNAKAPGRWRPSWNTHGNVLTLDRRPPMPQKITRPGPRKGRDMFLPIGVDEHGDEIGWDLTKSPHSLVAGETGAGKTIVLSGLVLEASAHGWDIVIVDGKGTALAGFRRWPGVVRYGLGEAQDMHEALVWVEGIMRERYRQVRDEGADPKSFKPILVVLDEFTEFSIAVQKWWAEEGAMENGAEVEDARGNTKTVKSALKQAPSLDSWSSIGRLGREGRVHIVIGIQQAAARIFGDTEKRDQLGYRLVAGPTTAESARMMFGRSDIGRDVPQDAKGRGTIVPVKGGPPVEVQAYWTPTPRPHGAMPDDPDDAALLESFRAASPSPARPAIAAPPVGQPVAKAEPPLPQPERRWAYRNADCVEPGWWLRFDGEEGVVIDGDYESEEMDLYRVEVRVGEEERSWTFDATDAVQVSIP